MWIQKVSFFLFSITINLNASDLRLKHSTRLSDILQLLPGLTETKRSMYYAMIHPLLKLDMITWWKCCDHGNWKINLINELIRHINLLLLTEQDQTHEINVIMSGSKILLQVFFHWGCWQLLKLEMWGSFLAFVTSCRDFRVHPRCCLVSVYNIIYTDHHIYIYHVTWRIHHKKRYKMRIYIHMYPSHIYIFFFQDTPCIYYEKKIIYIYICVLILPFKHKWEDPACSAFFQSSGEPARQVAGPRRQCRQAAVCWATRGFNGKGRRFSGLNMFKKYEKMHESCEIPRFFRAVSKSFEEREVRNLERLGIWKTNKQKHKQTKKTNKQTNQTKPNQTKPNQTNKQK